MLKDLFWKIISYVGIILELLRKLYLMCTGNVSDFV